MAYQWSVYQVDLDPTQGHEQSGRRPVLIVSAEPLNSVYGVITAISITSRKNGRPAHLGEVLLPAGLPQESFALCYQIRTLDKSRLERSYGGLIELTLQKQILQMLA